MGAVPHRQKRVLLVVAADETMQQMIAATFGRVNLDVLAANDADSASTLASVTSPALVVVVGSRRPPLNWGDAARILRGEPALACVPIIALGLEPEEQGGRLASWAGVDAYFQLPFQPFLLLMKVQQLLAQRCWRP